MTSRAGTVLVGLAVALTGCGGAAAAPTPTTAAASESESESEGAMATGEVHKVAQRTTTRVGDLSVGLTGVRDVDGVLTAQLTVSDASTAEANFASVEGAAGDGFDVYGRRLAIVEVAPGETGNGVVRFTLE